MKKSYLSYMMCFVVSGCTTPSEVRVKVNSSIEEDSSYLNTYENLTRTTTVYNKLEVIGRFTVTYLSPEFRSSLKSRAEELIEPNHELMQGFGKGKVGFFVSLASPDADLLELQNERTWVLQLERKGHPPLKPTYVRPLRKKEELRAYFGQVNSWSREFLVLFESKDLPSTSNPMELILKSSEATVHLNW